MPPKRRTASLYLRISVVTDESDSLARQERDLRRLAAEEGLEVVAVRVDEGLSGAAVDRPAFKEWLADAQEGRADTILAWRFDRISREGLTAVARILDVLKTSNARLLTFGDRADSDSPTFRLTAAVLSEVAYAEREAIKARVMSRQAADRRSGVWAKERPFGYLVKDGRLVQHPTEAQVVRDLVSRFMAGASLRSLAEWLDSEGVPTPRAAKSRKVREGARWGLTSVRVILGSPSLAGLYPHRLTGEDGRVHIVPARDDEGAEVVVTDAPILSRGEFAALQERLESRSSMGPAGRRRAAVGAAPKHPLSAMLRCGKCGGPLVFQNRSEGRSPIFRCQRRSHSSKACPGLFVLADEVESAVASRVVRRVAALEVDSHEFEVIASRWMRAQAPEEDALRRAARDSVADAEATVADLEAARYERGEFPGADGAKRWDRLYSRALARLEAAKADLGAFPDAPLNIGGLLDPVVMAEALESGTPAARRDLYRLILTSVNVTRDEGRVLDVTPVWAWDSTTSEAPLAS